MKIRISHFSTKNIEINQTTKPQPKILSTTEVKTTQKVVKQDRAKTNEKLVKRTQTFKKPTGIKLERIVL